MCLWESINNAFHLEYAAASAPDVLYRYYCNCLQLKKTRQFLKTVIDSLFQVEQYWEKFIVRLEV